MAAKTPGKSKRCNISHTRGHVQFLWQVAIIRSRPAFAFRTNKNANAPGPFPIWGRLDSGRRRWLVLVNIKRQPCPGRRRFCKLDFHAGRTSDTRYQSKRRYVYASG